MTQTNNIKQYAVFAIDINSKRYEAHTLNTGDLYTSDKAYATRSATRLRNTIKRFGDTSKVFVRELSNELVRCGAGIPGFYACDAIASELNKTYLAGDTK